MFNHWDEFQCAVLFSVDALENDNEGSAIDNTSLIFDLQWPEWFLMTLGSIRSFE